MAVADATLSVGVGFPLVSFRHRVEFDRDRWRGRSPDRRRGSRRLRPPAPEVSCPVGSPRQQKIAGEKIRRCSCRLFVFCKIMRILNRPGRSGVHVSSNVPFVRVVGEAVIRPVFVADPGRKGSVDVNSNCSYRNTVRILWHPTVAVGRPECVGSPTVCSYRCGSDPNRDRDRGGVEHVARWARNWTGRRNHCTTAYFVCTTGLCAEGCPPRRRKHPRVVDRFCWGAGDARGAGLGDIHASEAGKCPKMGQPCEAHITMMAFT